MKQLSSKEYRKCGIWTTNYLGYPHSSMALRYSPFYPRLHGTSSKSRQKRDGTWLEEPPAVLPQQCLLGQSENSTGRERIQIRKPKKWFSSRKLWFQPTQIFWGSYSCEKAWSALEITEVSSQVTKKNEQGNQCCLNTHLWMLIYSRPWKHMSWMLITFSIQLTTSQPSFPH